jgi:hypothetical protein
MTTSKNQRIVLGGGLLLMVLNGLFPPIEWGYYHVQGYRFLFALPDNTKIIFNRFFVQFVTLIAATAGAFFLFGLREAKAPIENKGKSSNPPNANSQPMSRPEITPETVMQTKIPGEFEKKLRASVSSFVAKEFPPQQDRERAEKYILGKLHFAAQFHYAQHKSSAGFNVSDQILKAAARFKTLKHLSSDHPAANEPQTAQGQAWSDLVVFGTAVFFNLQESLNLYPSREQWERAFLASNNPKEPLAPGVLDALWRESDQLGRVYSPSPR